MTTIYVVQRGDTLAKIASQFKTTVAKLAEDNSIVNTNIIHVGQQLKIEVLTENKLTKTNISQKVKDFINFLEGKALKRNLSPQQIGNINLLFQTCLNQGVTDLRQVAYVLATVHWETARLFSPIDEFGKGKGKPYGIPHPKTGKTYYGRGFVQITWYDNYSRFDNILKQAGFKNVDLVNKPEQANDPEISAFLTVYGMRKGRFTGRRLADYFSDTLEDWYNARRIINGVDKAVIIKDIAIQNYHIIK